MRIHWHSNAPWVTTGYGNQTKLFLPRIAKLGHYVSTTAFFGLQGGMIRYGLGDQQFNIHSGGRHPYGIEMMVPNAVIEQSDVLISLIDAWVIDPGKFNGSPVRWIPWFPIDSEPVMSEIVDRVRTAYRRIVFSKFAQSELEKVGLDSYYVPHGVDCNAFRPIDRVEARKHVNWPQDRYIVGMVAANKGVPPRKAFCEQITAFAAFHKRHPEALLYLHTDDGTHGGQVMDLTKYLKIMQLPFAYSIPGRDIENKTAVLFCDQFTNASTGFNDNYLNAAYNGMDVHMLVSSGEGFGIPIVEAQAAGCPVIVGDWTAMPELCFSGWKVDKREAKPFWNSAEVFQYYANPEAIYERLEAAYRMRGNQDYRKRARQGALAYDADKVTEKYWKPVLAEIEESLQERVEIEAVA